VTTGPTEPTGAEPIRAEDVARIRELLVRVRASEEERLREQWDRSLPFADALFDRWARARWLGFGEGASIYDSSLVYGDVQVGEETWIGPYTLLDGSGGGIVIGSYCSISTGVQIYTHDTVMWALSGGRVGRRTAPTRIGDRCHLGAQSIVAAGVELGAQCVVAANSFVNRSYPDRTVLGGTPASVLGRVRTEGDEIVLDYDARRDGTSPS
jgi:acetyltransferase-like isoleucine patch superfamily enzyme